MRIGAAAAGATGCSTRLFVSSSPAALSRGLGDGLFDMLSTVEHPSGVLRLVRRLSALALMSGLIAGNAALCAGWLPTPEARMACCSKGAACPMQQGESRSSGPGQVLTQTQADRCCAAAESQSSTPSSPSLVTDITVAVLGVGVVLPANVPALVVRDGWRTSAQVHAAHVPRHVLLSVFLV